MVIIPFAVRLLRDRPELALPPEMDGGGEARMGGAATKSHGGGGGEEGVGTGTDSGEQDGDGDSDVDGGSGGGCDGFGFGVDIDDDLDGAAIDAVHALTIPIPTTATAPPLKAKLATIFSSKVNWIITYAFVVCGITTTGFIETHIVGQSDNSVALSSPPPPASPADNLLEETDGLLRLRSTGKR